MSDTIRTQTTQAVTELLAVANLVPGDLLVVGCSTSEVVGTHIGTGGSMEIAGALVKEPTIVILDEATSALDAKTEHDVIEAIRDRDITTIIIAHRLSTIRDCDEIIVLDKGKVVQRGTHDTLYEAGGRYRELVSMN